MLTWRLPCLRAHSAGSHPALHALHTCRACAPADAARLGRGPALRRGARQPPQRRCPGPRGPAGGCGGRRGQRQVLSGGRAEPRRGRRAGAGQWARPQPHAGEAGAPPGLALSLVAAARLASWRHACAFAYPTAACTVRQAEHLRSLASSPSHMPESPGACAPARN